MLRAFLTIGLLIGSNCFMTWAWYGHLKKATWTLPVAIAVSWLIALPEYMLQVPANRIGHVSQSGPFTAAQLKVIQEAITLLVFAGFAIVVLKEKPRLNEAIAFVLIFAAVAVAMLGRPAEPTAGRIIGTPPMFRVPVVTADAGAPAGEPGGASRPDPS